MDHWMTLQRRLALAACLAIGLAWLGVYAYKVKDRLAQGSNDYLQLYAGSQLVGTPRLYKAEAAWEIHQRAFGDYLPSVVYTRPPFYAWLLQPLGRLPYRAAFWSFMALNFAGLAWYCWRHFRDQAASAFLVSCYPPLFVAILGGNDLGLVLALLGGAMLLMEKERDFEAGLLLSLCSIKFHLFFLLPAALWIVGRRRVLAGGAAGAAGLVALSFAVQGWQWPWQYLELLRNPLIHPDVQAMPNLHGMFRSLAPHAEIWATLAASAVVAGAVLGLAWSRREDWQAALAYSLLGGLLISWHCYMQDAVLLLPVLAVLQSRKLSAGARIPLAFLFSPLAFWVLSAGAPWAAVPSILMSCVLVAAVLPLFRPLWVLGGGITDDSIVAARKVIEHGD